MNKEEKTSGKENKLLQKWQGKFTDAQNKFARQQSRMGEHEMVYDGEEKVLPGRGNTYGGAKTADSQNVRNITHELIESEVDCTLPQPKVQALHPEDEELAAKIEAFLRAELERLPFERMNDQNERDTYLHGNGYFDVEWDPMGGLHETLGACDVRTLGSRQVVPQPGCVELEDMDYFFVVQSISAEKVRKRYGVKVSDSESNPEVRQRGQVTPATEEMVTLITCYYRNDNDGVGRYSWVNDTEVENYRDYLQKQQRICTKCGRVVTGEACACGGRKWRFEPMDEVEISEPVKIAGELLEPIGLEPSTPINPDGTPQTEVDPVTGEPITDENGQPVLVVAAAEVKTKVPVYKIRKYPVIVRRNIQKSNCFLGVSDVDVIRDQQNNIKKLGSKTIERLLKGGSVLTLPVGVNIETSDRELKIARLENPAQKALIDVLTLEPNIAGEVSFAEQLYEHAKSCIGITDSYQGKYDPSANSGTAKQTAVNQAAGRLESKRVMKHLAWAEMYERMFQNWLAFADDPACVSVDKMGGKDFKTLEKWEFLKRDKAGKLFWNDEFLFSVDTAALTPADRRGLQDEAKQNFANGAFGDPASVEARLRYWKYMNGLHYPQAETMMALVQEEKDAAEEAARRQAEMAAQQALQQQNQSDMEQAVQTGQAQGAADAAQMMGGI